MSFFPQKEWSDFAVVILAWWIESIIRVSKSKINSSCELLFMDGPYYVRGTKIDNDTLELKFIERDEVVLRSTTGIKQLLKSVLKASKTTLEQMEKKKWETKDTLKLKDLIRKHQY